VTGASSPRAPRRGYAAGSLYAFVVLGIPDGMIGVAWPVLRHSFGQPLASLGELLLASLAGYLISTSAAGPVLRRDGAAVLLTGSAAAACAGAALYSAGAHWPLLVLGSLLIGAAGGGLDAALNAVAAVTGRTRFMNVMHACYGVGAGLGPLMVTVSLAAGSTWRTAYAALLVAEAALLVTWLAHRRSFPSLAAASGGGEPVAGGAARRRNGLVMLGLAVFCAYGGLEVGAANWLASFLRGPAGLSGTLAGLTVFLYYAGLTGGRLAAAWLVTRVAPRQTIWAGVAGAIVGAALIWAGLGLAVTAPAVTLLGVSLGPIFPALMNLTPGRLGASTAISAVGWQLGAGAAGASALSAGMGVALQAAGLGSFGPILVALALTLAGVNLLLERAAPGA